MKRMTSSKETMNRREFNKLLSAAAAGILGAGALAGCKGNGKSGDEAKAGVAAEKHACKGLNTCKGKGGCATGDAGCAGKNSCKGKGGCATVKHECKGKNECKTQGGCKTAANACAGQNACKGQGGCAVPKKA
jgi:hypothetical protein